jgi:hypothetical protein
LVTPPELGTVVSLPSPVVVSDTEVVPVLSVLSVPSVVSLVQAAATRARAIKTTHNDLVLLLMRSSMLSSRVKGYNGCPA